MSKSKVRPDTKRNISNIYSSVHSNAEYLNASVEERAEMSNAIMIERQAKYRRFDAIAGVYQTADSILTNSSISVRVADFSELEGSRANAVAWNDGSNLYLNAERLHDITDDTIVSLNGVNYHEVAHLLWTPRQNTEFMKAVMGENLMTYFNILEDSRIETLMIRRFPSTKPSLTKASLTYLVEQLDEDTLPNAFPVICGRRYLPVEVRQVVADSFVQVFGSGVANRIQEIANEYRFLSLPIKADSDKGLELIREFSTLIKVDENQHKPNNEGDQPSIGESGSCTNRSPMKSGRNESGKKQSDLMNKAGQGEGEAESLDGNSKSNNKGQGESNSDKADGNGAGGNSNTKVESTNTNSPADESVAEVLRRAIAEVMNSSEVRAEAKQVRNAIKDSDRSFTGVGKTSYTYVPADSESRINAKAFSDELIQLQIDNDPAWKRHTPTGKLNVQRTMNMDINDINILFDRWDTGNEAFDIEAVVLVDNSGSMNSMMSEACVSAWTIKRALESIEGRTTVYTFDDETKLLYNADDKAGIKYRSVLGGGSTNPIEGLLEAENILRSSRRKTKLLFIVTDGEWYSEEQNNEIISRINQIDGAVTSLVFIGSHWYQERLSKEEYQERIKSWQHNCQTFTLVNRPREIVNVARDLVRSLTTR